MSASDAIPTRSRRSAAKSQFLSTGGKVALVGLLTALATLGFTVWVQASLFQQNRVRVPLSQNASKLEVALNESMAQIGGWILFKDAQARERSRQVWHEKIIPAYEELAKIADRQHDTELKTDIERLGDRLRRVQQLQLLVADLAHSPGNVEATGTYNREVGPLAEKMTQVILHLRISQKSSPTTLARLNELDAALVRVERTLASLLSDYTPAKRRQLESELTQLAALSDPKTYAMKEGQALDAITSILLELKPYVQGARLVAEQRASPRWNQLAFVERTLLTPPFAEAEIIIASIANNQNGLMITAGRRLARWSPVVVLLALFMGILSAGSLYTSIRMTYRMNEILREAKVLGQYVMEERIGGGGMGEVYKARHAMLRRPTAIKLLRASNATDAEAQERFRSEVQLTSQLTHPNTIDIFDYGRTPDGIFYYAMELLDGVDLNTLVDVTGMVPPERAVHILLQACGSLTEAHSQGLLHRDVKPSNIMLTELGGITDTVKVLDFGLVKQASDERSSNTIEGTPMFLAPEIIRAPGAASIRSDIYALGGVAYWLLTGTAVFESKEVSHILRDHLETPVERPSLRIGRELPPGLDEIVLSCLSKAPQDRPESAAHLAHLLRECGLNDWTLAEAKAWWADYAEALKAASVGPRSVASDVQSGLQIKRTMT